jgi:hypothetical protein
VYGERARCSGLSESIVKSIDHFFVLEQENPVDRGIPDPDAPLVAVEEMLKSDDIDAVISLGIVGRIEYLRLMNRSAKEVDENIPPGFLEQTEKILLEYEERYIAKTAELMEQYEKPVIGVSLAKTSGGIVRPVDGRRYSRRF